jgi:hypothetical protein
MSPGERDPSVERSRPAFAASTRSHPKVCRRSLERIAQADLVVCDESGQSDSVCLGFFLT